MSEIEKENNDIQEEDFAKLLDQYDVDVSDNLSIGDKVEGKVVHRSKENLHINIGTRSEAILSLEDPRTSEFKVDDEVTAYIKNTGGEMVLSLDPIIGHGDFTSLQQAYYDETPLEGTVIKVNKGGFEVNIAGIKCFCPISQLSVERIEEPEKWLSKTREFKIIELDTSGQSAVVSHRQLIVDEENRKRDELRTRLVEGGTLTGKVVEIMTFGAFVDLGGIRGLLHISELAHHKVNRVEDVLFTGQELEVQVVNIEKDEKGRDRIRLSRKNLLENPWNSNEFEEGQLVQGTPYRVAPFGIFVQIVDGIEGLIPKRLLRKAGKQVDIEDIALNEPAELMVVEANMAEQKLTLAFPGWDEKPESNLKPGEKVTAKVVKVLAAGVLVQVVDDPAKGLLPKRFLEKMNQRKLMDTFPVGRELTLVLESIDDKGRYTFENLDKKNEVDASTIEKYTDEASMAQNPFADFFNK